MTEYLNLNKANCKNCYKCIRNCPVKSIRFSGDRAYIIPDECVLCGTCFVVCPQNAKEIVSSLEKAKTLLQEYPEVYVTVAPSFATAYPGVSATSFSKAMQKLGFKGAQETAIGAQIVAAEYDRLVNEETSSIIISTCCASVNMLVERHYPENINYLAPVISPMRADAREIKKEHPNAKVFFVGPCISKKYEGDNSDGDIDCVLTFDELDEWMNKEKVEFENIPDENPGGRSRLFPTTGGILDTMKKNNPNYTYIAIDGIENCIKAMEDIKSGKISNCFIEMSSCIGSCSQGPGLAKRIHTPVKSAIDVKKFAAGQTSFEINNPLTSKDLLNTFYFQAKNKNNPSEEQIRSILQKTGKTRPEDELNCACCGYNTCREKAIAVFQGKADINMCLPFIKEKNERLSNNILFHTPNGILVLNEQLEVQQINESARRILNIRDAGDILGDNVIRILEPQDFLQVQRTGIPIKEKKVYLPEYDKFVIETIVYDRFYKDLLCILRDITEEEKESEKREIDKRKTIETTDKVVEKQMRVVQEIASLLGETTAETKVALTKLKESLLDEK